MQAVAKHAYLILAHNDIPLLQTLITCLDDSRNDLFVHWDAKSGSLPQLKTKNARLFMLDQRVDVNWAGYSMVQAEFLLFRKAFANGPYAYYHLLSGADLPIKSQHYIHAECEKRSGTEFIAFAPASQDEIDFRVQHYFLFPERFKGANVLQRAARKAFLKAQEWTRYHRTHVLVKKGSQWCSVTQDFVTYLLTKEAEVKKMFDHTFCPDELFVQTVCANSPFMARINRAVDEFEGNMRFIKWNKGELFPITMEDVPTLQASDRWFARKFSSNEKELIDAIQNMIHA